MQGLFERATAEVGIEHGSILRWFAEHEGQVGKRPWRRDGESVIEGIRVPLVAQRGIHQPSGWDCAVSITVSGGKDYLDDKPRSMGDGTWLMLYRAHSGTEGTGLASQWNRALWNNRKREIPVGVFVHVAGSDYENLGLAKVEDYYPDQDVFLLRGPVKPGQPAETWQTEDTPWNLVELAAESTDPTPLMRREALVVRREAQRQFRESLLSAYSARCAVTEYDAEPALQAAHIVAYSGISSQRPSNGLLLRADLHLLYDRHLFSIDPDGFQVWLSDSLRSTTYGELHRKTLRLPSSERERPDVTQLGVHWAVFSVGA